MDRIDDILKATLRNKDVYNPNFIRDKTPAGQTLLATIDIVFVDLNHWLISSFTEDIISRTTVAETFVNWIKSIWDERPRCKAIIVLMDRPRFMPIWRHYRGRSSLQQDCEFKKQQPLAYMWDDQRLGGTLGFQRWICEPQGRLECLRTLVSDLIYNKDLYLQTLAPGRDKVCLMDVDIPERIMCLWSEGIIALEDENITGFNGESSRGLMQYLKNIEKVFSTDEITSLVDRNYEIITTDTGWILTGLLFKYLSKAETFAGSAAYDTNLPRFNEVKFKIWWRKKDRSEVSWLSIGGWYGTLKTLEIEVYEPVASLLALVQLRVADTLQGTRLGKSSFSKVWKAFRLWQTKVKGPDKMLAYIEPKNGVVTMNWNGIVSFFAFFHDPDAQVIIQVNEIENYLKNNIVAKMKEYMAKIVKEEIVETLTEGYWKVLLNEQNANQASPLSLWNPANDGDAALKRSVVEKLSMVTNWATIPNWTSLMSKANLTDDEKIRMKDIYGDKLKAMILAKLNNFAKSVLSSTGASLGASLQNYFPIENQTYGPFFRLIYDEFGRFLKYSPDLAKRLIKVAFLQTQWELVNMTIGDEAFFLQQAWYRPASNWGWNGNTGESKVDQDLDPGDHYYLTDKSRFTSSSTNADVYKWKKLFLNDKPIFVMEWEKKTHIKLAPIVSNTVIRVVDDHFELQTRLPQGLKLELDSIYSTHDLATLLTVPGELWNAYMFPVAPFNKRSLPPSNDARDRIKDCASLAIVRMFPELGQILVLPTPHFTDFTPRFFATIQKFLSPLGKKMAWYAETWLRELFKRVYTVHKAVYLDTDTNTSLRREYDNKISQIMSSPVLADLFEKGLLGQALDYFTELLGSWLWVNNNISHTICSVSVVGSVIDNRKTTRDALLIDRVEYGQLNPSFEKKLKTIIPLSSALIKLWERPNVKFDKSRKRLEQVLEFFLLKEVYNPSDGHYYMAIYPTSNLESKKDPPLDLAFAAIAVLECNKFESFVNPIRWQQDWMYQDLTAEALNQWRNVYSIGKVESNLGIMGDPFKIMFYAGLPSDTAKNIFFNYDNLVAEATINSRRNVLAAISRSVGPIQEYEDSYFLAFIFSAANRTLELSFDPLPGTNHPAVPGVIYVINNNTLHGIMFHMSLWPTKELIKAFLAKLGINQPYTTKSRVTIANFITAFR